MKVKKRGTAVEIDLHGLRAADAEARLLHLLDHTGPEVTEILVIHGYSHGQALREMVWGTLRHPRIKAKLKTLNEGQTRLLIRKK